MTKDPIVLRSKEDLEQLFPSDIAEQLRFDEDPENSVIMVYLESLSPLKRGRFLHSKFKNCENL